MKKQIQVIMYTFALIIVFLLLSACGKDTTTENAKKAPEKAGTETSQHQAMETSKDNKSYEKAAVRLAVHSNEGAALTAIALKKGFFEKYGIDVKLEIVESGPPEMAAMRADNRTLDIGYIGPGVAWNPIDPTGNQLSFVFFDFLGNSERLLAREGIFNDANGNKKFDLEEIYVGLRGKTIYLEVGTTPGMWLMNLVNSINENKKDEEKLWLQCDVESYLQGYTAPNSDPENKISVVNYSNVNIPAAMATTDSTRIDIAVAFSPATTATVNAAKDVIFVADNTVLSASYASPGVWVASNKWIAENPDVVQRVINVLYEGAIYRTEHIDDSMRAGEALCQKPANSFNADVVRSLSLEEYREWFADGGMGWNYMHALYDLKKGSIPEGATPKSFEDSCQFNFFQKAIENITEVPK